MGLAITRRKDIDLARVRAAIEEAERGTSAEIVVSIAPFFFGDVWTVARRAFARLGVANTRDRNGVLVFVVPARRQVVVLADDGAAARLRQVRSVMRGVSHLRFAETDVAKRGGDRVARIGTAAR